MKLNLLGEDMKQPNAFENLKKHDHSASFDGLGEWLDQNSKQTKPMKNIYKVAASLIITALVLVACTVPLEQEEEIGYMIKGIADTESVNLKSKLAEIPGLKISQLSVHDVIFEQEKTGIQSASKLSELIMVLPEANYDAAVENKSKLMAAFDFQSIEILPIEETVERPLYEVALNKFDIKLRPDISDSEIAERIDEFLHENSSIEGKSNVFTDENGVRYVEIVIEEELDGAKELGIKFSGDANANIQLKRGIETLHQDLSQKNTFVILDSMNMKEVEIKELKERKEYLEKQKNN
ncbi:MAG: hypothetical protein ACMZ7B_09805 [Balneola sp.]